MLAIALRLVCVLGQLGRFSEADDLLAQITLIAPESTEIQKVLTEQHIRHNDRASAATAAEKILRSSTVDSSCAAITANLYLATHDAIRAEQLARAALLEHPDSALLVVSLTLALLAQKKNEEAEETARNYAAKYVNAAFDLLLARVLLELQRPDEAGAVIDTALAREPANAELHASAGAFWGRRGNRSRQLDLARTSIKIQGEDPAYSMMLGDLLAGGNAIERDEAHRHAAGGPRH